MDKKELKPKTIEITIGDIVKSLPRVQEKKSDDTDKKELQAVVDDKQNYQIEFNRIQLEKLKEEVENNKSDRALRKGYADKIIKYLQCYSIVVGGFVLLHGFGLGFALPEIVLTTLVGSTAVAAIGLVGFVAKGLFK